MSIELSYRIEPDYLCVEIRGQWNVEIIYQTLDETRIIADKERLTRLFFDLSNLSEPDNNQVRVAVGEYFAKVFGYPFRSAALVNPKAFNGTGEMIARSRGANLTVFFDKKEALAWLTGRREAAEKTESTPAIAAELS